LGLNSVAGPSGAEAAATTNTTSPVSTTAATTSRAATTTTGPCVTLTVVRYTPGQVVASYDFEQGILPATFFGLNGATLTRDPAAAHSGAYGLKISGLSRTAGMTVTLPGDSPGAYHVTAAVRSAPGEPARRVVLKLRDSAPSAAIGPNAWSNVDGYYSPETTTLNGCGGTVTVGRSVTATLTLQDEACGGELSPTTAYLDDLRVVYTGLSPTSPPSSGGACPPPPTTTTSPVSTTTSTTPATATTTTAPCTTLTVQRYTPLQVVGDYTFETTVGSWTGVGGATVSVDPAAARSGAMGLKVSGMSTTAGASFVVPAASVGNYQITAWVRFAAGEPSRSVALQLRDHTVMSNADGGDFRALYGEYSPEATTLNGCGGPVTVGKPFSATIKLASLACGGAPTPATAYIDDVTIVYMGSTTIPPTTPPDAGCTPPTTTTTTTTSTTTSTTAATSTTPVVAPACQLQYSVVSQWPGGYQAAVSVKNLVSTMTNWRLGWTFPGSDVITQLWSATYTQSGARVSVGPPPWSQTLGSYQSLTFGYLGSGAPTRPSGVTLNGMPCSVI
jgi:hypothetical protein